MADRYEYAEKATSPVLRGSFLKLYDKPDVDDVDPNRKTWQATGILAKEADKKIFEKKQLEAARLLWGDKAQAKIDHKKFKSPFRTGADMENRDGERFKGFEDDDCVVVKFSTSQGAPGVVDKQARRIKSWDGTTLVDKEDDIWEVLEENEVYSGMWMRCTFVAQAYERSDGFGVSFKLENIQKIRDDEKLGGGGRAKPEDDFEPVEDDDDDFLN